MTTQDSRTEWLPVILAVILFGIIIFAGALVLGLNTFGGAESDVPEDTTVIQPNDAPVTPAPNVATPIPTIAATLTLNPVTAGPETEVTVTGMGYMPNSLINIMLGDAHEGGLDQLVGQTTADASGSFVYTFTVSHTYPDGSEIPNGPIKVVASGARDTAMASAIFTYSR